MARGFKDRRRDRKAGVKPTRASVTVRRLGHQGDGVAETDGRAVYIPYTLADETVVADIVGERGTLVSVERASPDRVVPPCPHFGVCGGCAVQHMAEDAYRDWKRGIVVAALANREIDAEVAPLIDAHGDGRRRVTLHVKRAGSRIATGFNRHRGNAIVDLDHCPVLCDALIDAPALCREIAEGVGLARGSLHVRLTATESGLDVDIAGLGEPDLRQREALSLMASTHDLARLTLAGDIEIEHRRPELAIGLATVSPPPAGFLQATATGEMALSDLVLAHAPTEGEVADLFAGAGPFALRLAGRQPVLAVDSDAAALGALDHAARRTRDIKPVRTEVRDLLDEPLGADELDGFAGVVFDPPRAGAEAQAHMIADSSVPVVIGVSCNPVSFARDAAILIDGGYRLRSAFPVDQFRFAAHVEVVGVFERDIR